MLLGKIFTIVLWLMGAVGAAAVSAVSLFAGEAGMVSAFALVPLMWSVALGAGFVHHLTESGVLRRRRLSTEAAAGQPFGVLIPQ